MFTLNYISVPEKENTSPNGCFSSVGDIVCNDVDLIVFRLDFQIMTNE